MGLLRTLLALSVVAGHGGSIFGYQAVGGVIAVQSFYMISGFYMSLVLREKYLNIPGGFRLFISNRLLRLYPVYWVIFILTLISERRLVSFFVGDWGHFSSLSSLFMKFTNLFLFCQDWVMFLGLNTTTGRLFFTSDFTQTEPRLYTFLIVPQAWTIGVELMFYLLSPLLLKLRLRWIGFLMILSLALRTLIFYSGNYHDPWTYRFFPTELLFFLMGRVTHEVYRWVQAYDRLKSPCLLWCAFLAAIAFTVLFPYVPWTQAKYLYFLCIFLSIPFVFQLFKDSKLDSWMGELSYPIYVCHLYVIGALPDKYLHFGLSRGTIAGITILGFALVLNYGVAVPVEKLRKWRYHRVKVRWTTS